MYYAIIYVLGILLTSFILGMYERFNNQNNTFFTDEEFSWVIISVVACAVWPLTLALGIAILLVTVSAIWLPKKLHNLSIRYRDRALIRSVKKYQAKQG